VAGQPATLSFLLSPSLLVAHTRASGLTQRRILFALDSPRMARTAETLLAKYPPEVQALAAAARAALAQWLPRSEEVVDATAPVIAYAYGPGYKGLVCSLILSKTGVKIGLAHGSELPDPAGLLAGAGKVHKHIQLHSPSDLGNPAVRALVKAAYAAWKRR
jgi:hypothetical protein